MSSKQSGKISVMTIQTHWMDDEFKTDWSAVTAKPPALVLNPNQQNRDGSFTYSNNDVIIGETTGERERFKLQSMIKSVSIQTLLEIL